MKFKKNILSLKTCKGTTQKPRISIFKSNKHMYIQAIDDIKGHTIFSFSTMSKDIYQLFNVKNNKIDIFFIFGYFFGKQLINKNIFFAFLDYNKLKYKGNVVKLIKGINNAGLFL